MEMPLNNSCLVDCLIPLHLPTPLTYIWPFEDREPIPGTRLLLPLNNRKIIGILWQKTIDKPAQDIKLKEVIEVLDNEALLPGELIEFIQWASSYYFYPLGKAVAEALPPDFISSTKKGTERIASHRLILGNSKHEIIDWDEQSAFELSEQQNKALNEIKEAINRDSFNPILLFGVTGSGKTAVYIEAVKEALNLGKGILVMVPEIAMTSQLAGRFKGIFGDEIAILHSGLTPAQRRDAWLRLRFGQCMIALGTRSAIFSPIKNLGLIVVDEEHDPSYKQEERFKYSGRDLAIVRAKMNGATVILGSGTPSIQSFFNAEQGKYRLLEMKDRVPGARMPEVILIDRRKEKNKDDKKKAKNIHWMTESLKFEIERTLSRKEQVLLFLNRRGFATFIFCPECGYVFKCDACDVTLSWHRKNRAIVTGEENKDIDRYVGVLSCHYCNQKFPALPICPKCKGQTVKTTGFGTEKVAEELPYIFPGISVARIDRDTLSKKKELDEILRAFRNREIDCLVGTQMVTKGHDFPYLTLVGILWADMSLNVPEFNASERTFQLLSQVAGRAGRGKRHGRVLVQTFLPDHYSITFSMNHDFRGFYQKELSLRKILGYPPFENMINFRITGRKRTQVEECAKRLFDLIYSNRKKGIDMSILGPSPCPLNKIKSKYRFQLLIKGKRQAIRGICSIVYMNRQNLMPSTIRLEIDVDPVNFT